MHVDLRVKHGVEVRKAAIGLFERGHGFGSAAKALSVPRDTVSVFSQVFLSERGCGGNLGPNPSYAANRPKSLRYCMGLL